VQKSAEPEQVGQFFPHLEQTPEFEKNPELHWQVLDILSK